MDLQAQDERMLSAHLETCESCAKFHHQIQQVLLAADDVPLPDDLTPPQPESLARAIMEDLPEQKASPFAMFGNMFKGKDKPDKKTAEKEKPGRDKKNTMPPGMEMEAPQGSRYPHRSSGIPQSVTTQQFEDSLPPAMAPPVAKNKAPEDHSGTATRLKAIAKGMSEPLMDSREAQSTTRSLGEKFGMAGPNQLTDDQPLTLAESIRRKIAESQRATGEHEPIALQDELGGQGGMEPQQEEEPNWLKPPGLPNRQPVNGPTGLPGQGMPMPSSQSIPMPGSVPQMPPPMPAPNAMSDSSPNLAGNWGKPQSPQQEASNWGGPPGGGGGGGPAGGPPSMPGLQKPNAAGVGGNAWGDPAWGSQPPKGANGQDADWGPPPAGGAWEDPNEQSDSVNNSSQFAPPTQAPSFGKPQGMTPPNLDSPDQPWNKPIQAPQAAPPQAPAPAPAPAPVPTPAPAAAAAGGWGSPPKAPENWSGGGGGGWGAPPGPEAPAPQAPAPQAAAAAENNPWPAPGGGGGGNAWGGNASGWQQSPPGANQTAVPDSWATPPAAAAGWGQPGQGPQSGGNAAAAVAQAAPEPAPAAAGGWGTQGSSGSGWGQIPKPANDSWGAPPSGPTGGGWGQPGGGNAWGGDQPRTPEPAPAAAPAPAPAAAAVAPKVTNAWSVDAEQIETGTWRAFTPSGDSLGASTATPKGWGAAPAAPAPKMPPPPGGGGGGDQNRWDVPIQDRGAPAPADQAGANRWDQPIQNRATQEQPVPQAPAPSPAANAWGVPAPGAGAAPQTPQAPTAGVAGTGIPKDSIMDRLSNVLSEGQAPAGQTEESRWDLPIQERIKQDAMAAAPAPAAKAAGDNRWDTPIQDRSNQPQAPELSPPPPRWDVPIQERTQQLTPTAAVPPGEPLAAQPAAPAPWGSPPPAPVPAAPAPPSMPPAPPQPMAPPAMPFGSPADQGITASSWDLPVVEAQDQLHQRTQPEATPAPQPFAQPFGGAPAPAAPPVGGSPSRLNINPPAFTPGNVVQQPAAPPAPPPPQPGGALFNVDDSEIDKIFSEHLGINENTAPPAAPAKPEGPPQPAIMKSLPVSPPEPQSSGGGWGQPFGAPPLPGQGTAPQPFGTPPPVPQAPPMQQAPQIQPFAAPEPQPFTQQIPEPQPFATPAPAPMPFAAPAPEPVPMQPFGAPPSAPAPFAMPETAARPIAAQAPPPMPFAAQAEPVQAQQPFGAPPPAPFGSAPSAPVQGNPFAMSQPASPASSQPKIVPVMSKSVATASGGPPAAGWGAPAPGQPSNGPAPVAAAPAAFGAAPPPAVAQPDNKNNGLFNLDDSAMDDLFSKNLGVQETARPVGGTGEQQMPAQQQAAPAPFAPQQGFGQAPRPFAPGAAPAPFAQAPAPAPFAPPVEQYGAAPAAPQPFATPFSQTGGAPAPQAPAPFPSVGSAPPPPQQQQQQGGGLFNVDDSMMNKIFADNLGVKEADIPVNQGQGMPGRVNVAAAIQAISDAGQDVGSVPPPKIEGLGRLDAKPDQGGDTGSGRIASIGKFLLDQKDLEKIGKLTASDLSDTKMKILTLEAASEIQGLLHHIGGTPGVVGSIIIGHDGLLIANTMPQDVEADSIGIWALAVYMNTETAIKKIGHNRVHQVVARTPRGFLVIADFGGGLLVTLSDGRDTDALIPLMRSITQVVSN